MSDDDDEARQFQTKRQRLTKDQQTYGMFYEAYQEQRPSFGGGGATSRNRSHGKLMNFKAGELINPNEKDVIIDVPKKKKKKVTFEAKEKVHVFERGEHQQPPSFTMESFLNSINDEEEEAEEEEEDKESDDEEQGKPKRLEERIKTSLKLYKYSEYGRVKTMKDYGLPERFGKQSQPEAPPKPKKTVEQVSLEHEYREKYGMGYKIFEKMGFKAGTGLGKDGTGRIAPVEAVFQTALLVEDKPQSKPREPIVVPDQKHSSDEQTTAPMQKGVQQLFEYFSENEQVNSLLKHLKSEYERLSSLVDRQATQEQRIQSKLDSFQSSLIQNQNESKQLQQSLDELQDIRQNLFDCRKYPQHALRFNIDLLLVRMAMEKLSYSNFETMYNERNAIAGELFGLREKLVQLYMQKQKQNIRSISHDSQLSKLLFEKVIDMDKFQRQLEISDQDNIKIKRLLKTVLQDCIVQPWLLPKLKGWSLTDHTLTEQLINMCEIIVKIDRQVLQEPLSKYIQPQLNQYMCSFQLGGSLLPHLVVFPWLTVIKPDRFDYQRMIAHIHGFTWSPAEPTLLNCIRPWQEFFGRDSWQDFISLCIAPRLLQTMQQFTISASQNDSSNLTKLKGLMLYCPLLQVDHLQAILYDTLIRQISKTYFSLRQKQSEAQVQRWLQGWRKTLRRISSHPQIIKLLEAIYTGHSS